MLLLLRRVQQVSRDNEDVGAEDAERLIDVTNVTINFLFHIHSPFRALEDDDGGSLSQNLALDC